MTGIQAGAAVGEGLARTFGSVMREAKVHTYLAGRAMRIVGGAGQEFHVVAQSGKALDHAKRAEMLIGEAFTLGAPQGARLDATTSALRSGISFVKQDKHLDASIAFQDALDDVVSVPQVYLTKWQARVGPRVFNEHYRAADDVVTLTARPAPASVAVAAAPELSNDGVIGAFARAIGLR